MCSIFLLGDLDKMNHKIFGTATALFTASILFSQAHAQSENFYKNIMLSDELQDKLSEDDAKNSAAQILDSKPLKLNVETKQLNRRSHNMEQAQKTYGSAPFGLIWGITQEETESLGVQLTSIELKDYVNVFQAQNLPSELQSFDKVILIFGEDNKLWRILAYGTPLEDETPDASKIMKLYNKYYNLLAKKYGNAQQNYTGEGSLQNNNNLQAELISGNADVFSTFEGNNVGAALAINVEGSNKFYLALDYRNLLIFKENELQTLQAL